MELKEKRQKRFLQKKRHIDRQVKLKKDLLYTWSDTKYDMEPHRFHKVKSLNCGDPNCAMCGNPRKFFNEKTIQEKVVDNKLEDGLNLWLMDS